MSSPRTETIDLTHIDRIYGIVAENGLISETVPPFWNEVEVEVIRFAGSLWIS